MKKQKLVLKNQDNFDNIQKLYYQRVKLHIINNPKIRITTTITSTIIQYLEGFFSLFNIMAFNKTKKGGKKHLPMKKKGKYTAKRTAKKNKTSKKKGGLGIGKPKAEMRITVKDMKKMEQPKDNRAIYTFKNEAYEVFPKERFTLIKLEKVSTAPFQEDKYVKKYDEQLNRYDEYPFDGYKIQEGNIIEKPNFKIGSKTKDPVDISFLLKISVEKSEVDNWAIQFEDGKIKKLETVSIVIKAQEINKK